MLILRDLGAQRGRRLNRLSMVVRREGYQVAEEVPSAPDDSSGSVSFGAQGREDGIRDIQKRIAQKYSSCQLLSGYHSNRVVRC